MVYHRIVPLNNDLRKVSVNVVKVSVKNKASELNGQLLDDLKVVESGFIEGEYRTFASFLDKIESCIEPIYNELDGLEMSLDVQDAETGPDSTEFKVLDDIGNTDQTNFLTKTLALPSEILQREKIVRYILDGSVSGVKTPNGEGVLDYMLSLIRTGSNAYWADREPLHEYE
jgi:hypothetical protein